jgi:hypothetical protein
VLRPLGLALFLFLWSAPHLVRADDLNSVVLDQVRQMPKGGRYSVSHFAKIQLEAAAHFEHGKFFILPPPDSASFCSGATYLLFIKTVEALRSRGGLQLDLAALESLIIHDQHDGEGVWGRWNANGPGTARLFHELDLGSNFVSFEKARPGDFIKIFWSKEVGRNEHGHSAIYLGSETRNGIEYVRFWSSNVGAGYSEKEVPRAKIAAAIFSRLEKPANLSRASQLPEVDSYLASLLTKRSSLSEAQKKCGI